MSWTKQQETSRDLAALDWIKRGVKMGKDTSKPIRFKTIQKNTKLAEFVLDESPQTKQEEQHPVD